MNKNNKKPKCPKCNSELEEEIDHGIVILVCPIDGTNWQTDDTQLQGPRGRNQYYRIARRRIA